MNAVTTDVNNTSTPALIDWQADLCDKIDKGTYPTVLKPIAPTQPLLGIAIMQGLRAVITATR
eukprot:5984501-Pleurochrysis_carterae.AAC.1